MTYAVLALPVYSRLIGSYHSGHQRLAVEVLADILRTFVDIEVEPYTVACPVAEIAFGGPERFTGKGIDLATCRSTREYRLGEEETR